MKPKTKQPKRIPIAAARSIAEKYGYDQVLILARHVGDDGKEHIATYGVDKTHCAAVARVGAAIVAGVVAPLEAKDAEIARLRALLNNPQVKEFFAAVEVEAAHQREKWGENHDAGKDLGDWSLLFQYIMGKQAQAVYDQNWPKYLHHLITLAAICSNAHRALAPGMLAPPAPAEPAATDGDIGGR